MSRPMIQLALGVTILDIHTRLACLETNAPLFLATLGAAVDSLIVTIIHPNLDISRSQLYKTA